MSESREGPVRSAPIIKVLMTTHNRVSNTVDCLQSLFDSKLEHAKIEVVIVDAGSADGTVDRVAGLGRNIILHSVSTDYYWAMGMRRAWELVQQSDYDYLLWLNDDVVLDEHAIQIMLDTASSFETCAVVGAVTSNSGSEITYSGFRKLSKFRPLKLARVDPTGVPQSCDTINGNVVLIPASCDHSVGGFPKGYSHALADLAYGFELRKAGIPIILAPTPVGRCDRQQPNQPWLDQAAPLSQRLHSLRSPKGLPFGIWLRFCLRYGGYLGIVNAVKPYVLVLIGATKQLMIRRP